MSCPVNKIDSNNTGLRIAEEACLKRLPSVGVDGRDPVWLPLEPNGYNDFGGQITNVARNPINPSRQRKKGSVTDLEASGGFTQDLTFDNTTRLLQGYIFADARHKPTTAPINGSASVTLSSVVAADNSYEAASGLANFLPGHLVLAAGFSNTANNGIKQVVSSLATEVVVSTTLVNETPSAAAKLSVVGYRFPISDAAIVMNGSLTRLTSVDANLDDLGLIPGEWIFLGGDTSLSRFANNRGFARVSVVTPGYIEFDKVDWSPVAESAGTFSIEIYFGTVIKNESDPLLIKRRSYQLERTLGQDADGTMSEYLIGAIPSELTINVPQAEKVTVDMMFMACDHTTRTGLEGVLGGARPSLVSEEAFNTSSDFSRIKLAVVSETDSNITPLFAFGTDLTIQLNNNVSANKALGVLGAFDMTAGTFEVGGSLTAYFADVNAVRAVRTNEDITLDVIMVRDNTGLLFDIPLLTLGNGRLNVEQDQPITLPLDTAAAESRFGHTLLVQSFPYLPSLAAA